MLATDAAVRIISSNFNRLPCVYGLSIFELENMRRLFIAINTNRFNLFHLVSLAQQGGAAREELILEVFQQAIDDYRDSQLVYDPDELIHMVATDELSLVNQHAMRLD